MYKWLHNQFLSPKAAIYAKQETNQRTHPTHQQTLYGYFFIYLQTARVNNST